MKTKRNIILLGILLIVSPFCDGKQVTAGTLSPSNNIVLIPAEPFGFQKFTYKPGTQEDKKGNIVDEPDAKRSDWSVVAKHTDGLFNSNPMGNNCNVSYAKEKKTNIAGRDDGTVSCKDVSVKIRAN